MTSKGQTVGTVTKTVGYGFTNGNLTLITTPSGQSVGYGYNSNHQVTSVSVNGATVLSSALYDPFGPVRGWTWGNGTLAVRTYDTDGFLRQVDSAGLSTYTPLDDLSIGTRTDDVPMPVGIPTGTTNYTPSPTSNRLVSSTGVQGRSYIYDNAGNTTTSGSLTFNYNYRGRMSFTSGAATSYLYNALGQRVKKSNASLTRLFMYDEAGHLLGEYDATGALVEETVWLGDIPVATIRPGTPVGIYYVHTDHLNTPRRVSRPSDNRILWRWDSDPFGQAAANEDADGDSQVFSYNLRFPGQYFDSESGLSQNYFRDYAPAIGRYVESDPIGLKGGVNTYNYASAKPLKISDPSGLCSCQNGGKSYPNGTPDFSPWFWQSQDATIKCSYDCTSDDGKRFTISATLRLHQPAPIFGGDPNTIFVCPYVRVSYRDLPEAPWVSQTSENDSFDPRESSIQEIRKQGETNCQGCKGK